MRQRQPTKDNGQVRNHLAWQRVAPVQSAMLQKADLTQLTAREYAHLMQAAQRNPIGTMVYLAITVTLISEWIERNHHRLR